jgi:hypothetical protein
MTNVQRQLEGLAQRQAEMEELQARYLRMEEALANAEAERNRLLSERATEANTTQELLRAFTQSLQSVKALSLTPRAESDGNVSGPRDWKPPTWDGKAETFRDYLLRIRSSYRVRSASKPTLAAEYYWDAVYDTLPSKERARMRHFWEKGSPKKGKDPEAFFTQLEEVFADSNEQSKALERLTTLKHAVGQPWHEHQLEFDGLLLSAGGDSWPDLTKIGYLKNTFSNSAKLWTATMQKLDEYYPFAEEVERIMTNVETTDKFKALHQKWAKGKGREARSTTTVTTRSYRSAATTRIDADGDTIMTPTHAAGPREKKHGDRRPSGNKRKAKWVDTAELKKRREKKLCYRCGGDGHRIKECPFAPAERPMAINITSSQPMLESEEEDSDSTLSESGKE